IAPAVRNRTLDLSAEKKLFAQHVNVPDACSWLPAAEVQGAAAPGVETGDPPHIERVCSDGAHVRSSMQWFHEVPYGFPRKGFTMRTPSISCPCCMSSENSVLQPDCLAVCTTKASQKGKPCRRWRSIAARMSPR